MCGANVNDFRDATADNPKLCIDSTFLKTLQMSQECYQQVLVLATADGTSVNFGKYNGLLTHMKCEREWLLTVHALYMSQGRALLQGHPAEGIWSVQRLHDLSLPCAAVEADFSHLTNLLSGRRLSMAHKTMEAFLVIRVNDPAWSESETEIISLQPTWRKRGRARWELLSNSAGPGPGPGQSQNLQRDAAVSLALTVTTLLLMTLTVTAAALRHVEALLDLEQASWTLGRTSLGTLSRIWMSSLDLTGTKTCGCQSHHGMPDCHVELDIQYAACYLLKFLLLATQYTTNIYFYSFIDTAYM